MTIDGVWSLLTRELDGSPGKEIVIRQLPSEYIVSITQTYKRDEEMVGTA